MSADYPYALAIPTRWMDTDPYGHVNNAQYYSYFDTVVTTWLVEEGGRDPATDPVIGLCVESRCSYDAPLHFPETVTARLRVGRLGRSSVRYEIELRGERTDGPAATGHFVHVQVDRARRVAVPIPDDLRERLETLVP